MSQPETLKFTPYARLLTMIGDQLIKDERVALVELVKNAYDADASEVKVSFENFDSDMHPKAGAAITIEDDGCGMSKEVITRAWMAPASPNKKKRDAKERFTMRRKRVMQGEKGIGRFAMLKLGSWIEMTTHPEGSDEEYTVVFDFTKFGEEFSLTDGEEKFPLLEDIHATIVTRKVGKTSAIGTRLVIKDLKPNAWNRAVFDGVRHDTAYMQPIFSAMVGKREKDSFIIKFFLNGEFCPTLDGELEKLRYLLAEKSVLRVSNGKYNAEFGVYDFELNGNPRKISFKDLRHYASSKSPLRDVNGRLPECGSYEFAFYLFDRKVEKEDQKTSRFWLTGDEPEIIANHRVYLYRDGIRVYPYGDPDDDWLQLDALRGTARANVFPSNDQIVGCVDITHEGNPNLKDKTSREGLVSQGNAVRDFIESIQVFLQYLRREPYDRYRQDVQARKALRRKAQEKSESAFTELEEMAKDDPKLLRKVQAVAATVLREKAIQQEQSDTLEDLAAVGMSIETATHDLLVMAGRADENLESLRYMAGFGGEKCRLCLEKVEAIKGAFSFVEQRIKDLQPLFKSTYQRTRPQKVSVILKKVMKYYSTVFSDPTVNIQCEINEVAPLEVESTEAVLMQSLINLLDNSLYWLRTATSPTDKRLISIVLDGCHRTLTFSDNGPGISDENRDYVFKAFFSTKRKGRGLGLYIARQLLGRYGFSIRLASKAESKLQGAAFVIDFNVEEE